MLMGLLIPPHFYWEMHSPTSLISKVNPNSFYGLSMRPFRLFPINSTLVSCLSINSRISVEMQMSPLLSSSKCVISFWNFFFKIYGAFFEGFSSSERRQKRTNEKMVQ